MSSNLSGRQQLNNAIVPLVCFSIAFLLFVFAGQSIAISFFEFDPADAELMQILLLVVFGLMLLAGISQFVKAYKKYIQEKNAPPRPATPAQPAADLARTREFQRAQAAEAAWYQPAVPGSTVTYSTAPQQMATPQTTRIIEKEKVIIKEIIKLKCPYCGMLVDHVLSECPNCGGRM